MPLEAQLGLACSCWGLGAPCPVGACAGVWAGGGRAWLRACGSGSVGRGKAGRDCGCVWGKVAAAQKMQHTNQCSSYLGAALWWQCVRLQALATPHFKLHSFRAWKLEHPTAPHRSDPLLRHPTSHSRHQPPPTPGTTTHQLQEAPVLPPPHRRLHAAPPLRTGHLEAPLLAQLGPTPRPTARL